MHSEVPVADFESSRTGQLCAVGDYEVLDQCSGRTASLRSLTHEPTIRSPTMTSDPFQYPARCEPARVSFQCVDNLANDTIRVESRNSVAKQRCLQCDWHLKFDTDISTSSESVGMTM